MKTVVHGPLFYIVDWSTRSDMLHFKYLSLKYPVLGKYIYIKSKYCSFDIHCNNTPYMQTYTFHFKYNIYYHKSAFLLKYLFHLITY